MYSTHKLKNGIKVILSPQKETRAVSLLVLIKVGSRQESENINGIAHFLEHLIFKGTQKRPNTEIISQELDALGADYNAYTSKDHTAYYIKTEKSALPKTVDILSDMLIGSVFDKEEIERERGTILEEINMYEDNPMSKIDNLFEEALYGPKDSLGRHIIGTPKHIKSITQKQIISYWKKHYNTANMAISVSGNLDKQQTLKILQEKFFALNKGNRNSVKKQSSKYNKPKIKLFPSYKKTSQAHLILGFPGASYTNNDKYVLGLLSVVLGGNMSSRFFIKVRERLGLCYFIRASNDSYEDTGSFSVQAGLDLKNLEKALIVIGREFADIKKNSINQGELSRAKQFLKGKMALDLEDSLSVASFFGKQSLFQNNIKKPEEIIKKIEKISLADIKKIANKYLDIKKMNITTLSPYKGLDKFVKKMDF